MIRALGRMGHGVTYIYISIYVYTYISLRPFWSAILIPFAEEILSQSSATWFSTDGSYLMYASFNTSQVGQVSFKIYGGDDPNNVFEDTPLYGDTMSLRYPKVS